MDDLKRYCLDTLVRAVHDRHHGWRVPVISTASAQGPQARCVILRGVLRNPLSLDFFTDRRSGKVAELAVDTRMQWTFWNPKAQEQLRVWTEVDLLLEGPVLEQAWSRVPAYAWRDYATATAGSDEVDMGEARGNFAVGRAMVKGFEFLRLSRDGHVTLKCQDESLGTSF